MPFVSPGTGWPEDPATPETPVAHKPQDVMELAESAPDLAELCARQSVCRACDRLVEWREKVALERRRAFADEEYWGRPIAGWGDPEPRILLVGLAPAAHGGNRTGRVFTGDRSGDWLFASLHRVGLASQATSVRAGDGQHLIGTRLVATVRCAPPDNKPTTTERATCLPWLNREMAMIAPSVRCIVALGGYAWQSVWPVLKTVGYELPRPRPAFGHGAEVRMTSPGGDPVVMLGTYHPSQQNTFTGRLTEAMLDDVLGRAATYL
ncbi:uracil-DNA glycosylase [Actinomadura barringtoniae]|uniref:Type-5 uracil-DNA glycosylase n=1 Tax=Actinomadura barringtoniae TaxID=1427535 RepID=A0A939P788_9ACTN|nr:uracil-DNA glycosylase [Actinomadura barringtoniae]MBO2446951.1 uracil-DNA glycosylase [Actinomadura barringtoniae]